LKREAGSGKREAGSYLRCRGSSASFHDSAFLLTFSRIFSQRSPASGKYDIMRSSFLQNGKEKRQAAGPQPGPALASGGAWKAATRAAKSRKAVNRDS
jgi:hypothetical protein